MYVLLFLLLISCDALDWLKPTDDDDDKGKNNPAITYTLDVIPPQQMVSGHEFSFKVSLFDDADTVADVSANVSLLAKCDGKTKDIDAETWETGEATFSATFELDENTDELECKFFAETSIDGKVFKSEEYKVMLVRQVELVVIGDSLATGVFSDVAMGSDLSSKEFITHQLIASMIITVLSGKKFSYDVMDEQLLTHHENPFTCAATGEQSECKFSYQKQVGLKNYQVKNLAQTGAETAQVLAQLDTVASLLGNAKTYIISVGGNDFCSTSFTKESYIANVKAIVTKIKQQNSEAKILIAAMPNVLKLITTVAPSDNKAVKISGISELGIGEIALTCGQIRDGQDIAFGDATKKFDLFCPRITSGIAGATDSATTFIAAQETLLTALGTDLSTWASSEDNVKYVASITTTDFVAADIAADCIHPSKSGQKKIADELFKNRWDS